MNSGRASMGNCHVLPHLIIFLGQDSLIYLKLALSSPI